ncbi:Rv3235 family protein [Leifsonia aquatica]|uniref:Rv3235 family protein n=1 Tax=Leifsonia aquatica TaxID=144185 RepID=UPI0028A6CC02|nr:Rv3235 family protein [Leifsonia aquatica]
MSTRATTIERLAPRGRTTPTDTTTATWQGRRGDLHDALPEAARRSFAVHPVNHRPRARTIGADADAAASRPAVEPSPAVPSNTVDSGADQARLDQIRLEQARLDQDPALLCANLALCVVEILAGARALDQIGRWVTDSVFVHLLRRTVIAARSRAVSAQEVMRPRFSIGTPRLTHPAEGVVEAVVMVHQVSRSRAIALRLERHRSRWRATAISVL